MALLGRLNELKCFIITLQLNELKYFEEGLAPRGGGGGPSLSDE